MPCISASPLQIEWKWWEQTSLPCSLSGGTFSLSLLRVMSPVGFSWLHLINLWKFLAMQVILWVSLILFIWFIASVTVPVLNYPCIPVINLTWSFCVTVCTYIARFNLLIFSQGILHLCSWRLLICNFPLTTLSGFGICVGFTFPSLFFQRVDVSLALLKRLIDLSYQWSPLGLGFVAVVNCGKAFNYQFTVISSILTNYNWL